MRTFTRIIFVIICFILNAKSLFAEMQAVCQKAPCPGMLVAHAGGIIQNTTYTNSLEALDNSYKSGFKFFEIDLNWTSDKKIVCIHDWNPTYKKLFGTSFTGSLPLEKFINKKTLTGITPCTLTTLIEWMQSHKDSYIITDIKSKNIFTLTQIADTYPEFTSRFIPQIYTPEQYEPVKKLGYKAIIFTLYANSLTDKEVIAFAREKQLFAVTMTKVRSKNGLASELSKSNIFTYAHTINAKSELNELYKMGFQSFYTDRLSPLDIVPSS